MNVIVPLIIFLVICGFGLFLHQKTLKKLKFYQQFLQFCQNALPEINYFCNKLPQIISKQNVSGDFKKVLDVCLCDELKKVLDDLQYLSLDEKEEIKNFFSKLGRGNSSFEKQEIENFVSYLSERLNNIKSFGLKKSKLKLNLSIMFGLFVFIVLV